MWRYIRHHNAIMRAILLYMAVVVALFRRAIVPPQGWLLFGDDIHRSYYFYRAFLNGWLKDGIFPWWNPYLFGGAPFIADPIINLWYPVNWLFIVLPINIAYSWHVAFHVIWAMTGMYALGRFFRLSAVAAWTGGILFGLSGFFMARIWSGHVDVLAAASWIPWVVWAMSRCAESGSRRDLVVGSIVFAMQLIAGYQTMALMSVIIVGMYALVFFLFEKRAVHLWRMVLAGIGGIGLAAFHLVPVQEFFLSSIRTYALPYSWVSYGAWHLESLVLMLNPYYFGDQRVYNGPPPNFGEHSAFVGVIGLILVLLGIVMLLRAPRRAKIAGVAFFCIVVFGVWMSLGPHAPVLDLQYIAWKTLPMYKYLRIPTRHLILVSFGLSMLAAFGLSAVSKAAKQKVAWVPLLVSLMVMVEMLRFGMHFIDLQPFPQSRHDSALIATLSQDSQPYRVLQNFGVWIAAREVFDFDSAAQYRIFSATGYGPGIYRPYYEYIARATGISGEESMLSHDVQVPYLTPAEASTIDKLNIKYILVPPDYDPFAGNTRYRLIREDAEQQFRLYENTTVFPRFYLSEPSCGTPRVVSYTPNSVTLSVESSCDATLLSSEVWYPGWRATVDGKNVRVDKQDGVFRTLFVSRGKHTVRYFYLPRIFVIGGIISLITLIVMCVFMRKGR